MENLAKEFVKSVQAPFFDDDAELKQIYLRVIEEPNKECSKKGFITCPDCGEKILMVPTLRVMNSAIENHVNQHKAQLKTNPIKEHQTAISIRFSLMGQVLQQASRISLS